MRFAQTFPGVKMSHDDFGRRQRLRSCVSRLEPPRPLSRTVQETVRIENYVDAGRVSCSVSSIELSTTS